MIRLGFVGTGWIGRNRMEALLATGEAFAVAVCDPSGEMLEHAKALAPLALEVDSLDAMLALDLDGIVIATPSALHAEQCIRCFDAGAAAFCQKPLGRTVAEVEAVLAAARRADRLLGVDLSYRYTAAVEAVRERIRSGELGKVFVADLTFHNGYGPGAGWFWDPKLSGGGCLIDLGVHLVDLALWMFDFPDVAEARAVLLRDGRPAATDAVEDFAEATLALANGVQARIACSWNLNAGREAVIGGSFYGTEGGAAFHNVDGSFYDFAAQVMKGRDSQLLASPPDAWGGRAAVDWLRKLAAGERFSGSTSGLIETARALDRLYGRI